MKIMVGVDKGEITNVNPSTNTITISGLGSTLSPAQFLIATDISSGTLLYNFADPTLNITVSGQDLTFDNGSLSGLNANDIQIFMEDGTLPGGGLVPERHTNINIVPSGNIQYVYYYNGAIDAQNLVATLKITKDTTTEDLTSIERI